MARDTSKTEAEYAEEQVRDFNASDLAAKLGLEAHLDEHRFGDFTVTIGMDDGRDEPWPVTVHAIYNSVDGFDEWWSALDRLETAEEQRGQLIEDCMSYAEAISAGYGNWHLGSRVIESRKAVLS